MASKEGYVFLGWYDAADGDNKIVDGNTSSKVLKFSGSNLVSGLRVIEKELAVLFNAR